LNLYEPAPNVKLSRRGVLGPGDVTFVLPWVAMVSLFFLPLGVVFIFLELFVPTATVSLLHLLYTALQENSFF